MKRLLLIFALSSSAFATPSPTPFATVPNANGIAAKGDFLYVTEYCTGNVDQVDSSGNVTLFATIPAPSVPTPTPTPIGTPCVATEKYIAVVPPESTPAGFTVGDIFVTQGQQIYNVTTGTAVLFATISACGFDHTGITFDTVGTFGNKMIVTCNGGDIFTVDSGATATQVGDNIGTNIESPIVAPSPAFGTYGGQILVTDEGNGGVHAIDNLGNLTINVATWGGAEGLALVASDSCYYVCNDLRNTVYRYRASDFSGFAGDIMVGSETGQGIGRIHWNGSGYDVIAFDNRTEMDHLEGSTFAFSSSLCPTPTPTPTPAATATATPIAVTSAWGYIF